MGNFENRNSNLREFIKTANETGLSKPDKKKVLGIVDEKRDKQRYYPDDVLLDRIDSESVEAFTELVSGGEVNHRALVDIGNTLREYGTSGGSEKILAPDEEKIVSLVIKYIENWFYSDGIIKMIGRKKNETDSSGDNNDLAAAAFVINQLAKIKENPRYHETIKNIDSEKLSKFIDEVGVNIPNFFSEEKLDAKISDRKVKRDEEMKKHVEEFEAASKTAKPLLEQMDKECNEFSTMIDKNLSAIEHNINVFPASFKKQVDNLFIIVNAIKEEKREYQYPFATNIMNSALDYLKNKWNNEDDKLIRRKYSYDYNRKISLAEELSNAQQAVAADLKNIKNSVETLLNYLQGEVDKTKETNLKKTNQKFSGFDSLKGFSINSPSFDYQRILNAFNEIVVKEHKYRQKYFEIERKSNSIELDRLKRRVSDDKAEWAFPELSNLLVNRRLFAEIISNFEKSKKIVQEALKGKDSSAALYFIKSLLIIAAEMRGKDVSCFNPRSISSEFFSKKPIYSFEKGVKSEFHDSYSTFDRKTFNQVHFEPSHIMCAQFALAYQRQKFNKSFS